VSDSILFFLSFSPQINISSFLQANKPQPANKRPRSDNDADLDPDGETRHQLGMSLKRRKIEYTGKWEMTRAWPELRYKAYGRERLVGLLSAGASEEQKGWLGRWVRSGGRG
jgi:hypothetical protein